MFDYFRNRKFARHMSALCHENLSAFTTEQLESGELNVPDWFGTRYLSVPITPDMSPVNEALSRVVIDCRDYTRRPRQSAPGRHMAATVTHNDKWID